MLLREEVILPWAFPPTLEQGEKFKSEIIAKVDQMLKWLWPTRQARFHSTR
jgi:hypothetical protein